MKIFAGKMAGYNWEWALDPDAPPRLRERSGTLIMGKEWLRKNAPKTFANWVAARMHGEKAWSVDGEELRGIELPIEWGS